MAKDYVMGCVLAANGNWDGDVLLILKDRPAWMAGRLNLVGGKVEEGESPEDAMIREFREETSLVAEKVKQVGVIRDREFKIYCYNVSCNPLRHMTKAGDGETEQPIWMRLSEAYEDPRLLPNLRVIIPLMRSFQSGWIIEDDSGPNELAKFNHTLKVTVPTYR